MKKPTLKDLVLYFLKLGSIGFGGSIVLAHAMHKDLVQEKHWIDEKEYLRGLTLSQLAPGPLSAQLAIYIGYVTDGVWGATLSGIAFIFPSFLLVVLLSIIYLQFGALTLIQAALYGIGASVIGIIASSAYSLTTRTMKPEILLWIIFVIALVLFGFLRQTSVVIFILAGVITMLVYTHEKLPRPPKLFGIAGISVSLSFVGPLAKLFSFFLQAGTFAFGGGLAIVPFLQTGVVEQYHWLTQKQFIDAIAVAMITPGPVVIAATFIGYLVAGISGAIISTIAIFLPVYLIVILLTPLFIKHAENPQLIAFIEGVIAAAMGAIAGSIITLGEKSIIDPQTLCIAIAAFLFAHFLKIPSVILVICAGILGLLLYH